MEVVVGVTGWADGLDVLLPCLESVKRRGWRCYYLDGAYVTYVGEGAEWRTPEADLIEVARLATVVRAERPWEHEAEKRTALLRLLIQNEDEHGAQWGLLLDADERIEGGAGRAPSLRGCVYGTVELREPDLPGSERALPRLVRLYGGMEFRPPWDYELWYSNRLLVNPAKHGLGQVVLGGPVPRTWLRLRHERSLRPAQRRVATGLYCRRRAGEDEHGRPLEGIREAPWPK